MAQVVDVIELLKVQVINKFENLVKSFRKGYSDLDLTCILDDINFIESCGYLSDASKIGRTRVDLSDLDSIETLNEYSPLPSEEETVVTKKTVTFVSHTGSQAVQYDLNSTQTLPNVEDPEGYEFEGWVLEETLAAEELPETLYESETEYIVNNDITLYALYSLTETSQVAGTPQETTLWKEEFEGINADVRFDAIPKTHMFVWKTEHSVTYSQTGTGVTWNENVATGTSPEILVAKSSYIKVSNIPIESTSSELKLTLKSNKDITVSVNENYFECGSRTSLGSNAYEWLITPKYPNESFGVNTIDITMTNPNTGANARIDNMSLTGTVTPYTTTTTKIYTTDI